MKIRFQVNLTLQAGDNEPATFTAQGETSQEFTAALVALVASDNSAPPAESPAQESAN